MSTTTDVQIPRFESYGEYSSSNYGVNTLVFTDAQGRSFYYSYKTLVAVAVPGRRIVRQNVWSVTTGKHLNWIDGGDKASRLTAEEFNVALSEMLA